MSYQRDFDRRIDVALVGAGSHAYRNILPALHYLPVRLRAVCDVNLPLARKTAAQYADCRAYASTAEMYRAEALQAVMVAVGPELHPALTVEAFAAGLHVWLEKPVAMRATEVARMDAARGDRVCVVGFKKAFMPVTRKVIEIVRSPKYAGLKSMLAVYPMDLPKGGAAVLESRKFTNWLGNGVHPLSLLLAVGGPVAAVTAVTGAKGVGSVVLEFASGVVGTFVLAGGPQPIERYAFFADGWHAEIDNCLRLTLQRGTPFQYGVTTDFTGPGTLDASGAVVWEPQNCLATLENKALFTQGIFGELKYFCDCVLENRPAETGSLAFAHHVMNVYEAVLLSGGGRVGVA